MIDYSSKALQVGYLQEFLRSFNLPTMRVFTQNDLNEIRNETSLESKDLYPFILREGKSMSLVSKTHDGESSRDIYVFGERLLNLTQRLSNEYVSYNPELHIQLGKYLRFYKDVSGIDLMPLYNCFTGETEIDSENQKVIFKCAVRYHETYTICFNSASIIKYRLSTETKFSKINMKDGIGKVTIPWFESIDEEYEKEPTLTLLIEADLGSNSSFACLEGDYTHPMAKSNYGNSGRRFYPVEGKHLEVCDLLSILTDKEYREEALEGYNYKPMNLQLMSVNDGINHPFSDKLIPYMMHHFILPDDPISDNIGRVEELLYAKVLEEFPEMDALSKLAVREALNLVSSKGVWADIIRFLAMYFEINYDQYLQDRYDLLWYIDKDVEETIGGNA